MESWPPTDIGLLPSGAQPEGGEQLETIISRFLASWSLVFLLGTS